MIPEGTNSSGEEDGRTERGPSLARRRYLQSLAVAGLIGAGSTTAAGDDSGETDDSDDDDDLIVEVPDDEEWEALADERIQAHRTAPLTVEVTTPDGEAVDDAEITIEQQSHDYGFGTAVNAETLIEETDEGDEYREYIPELFNKAVMENRHKWRFFEEQQELADEATDWILDQGLDMRGHACLWANRGAYAIPADVEDAIDDGDAEYVRERTLEHIEEIITHYGDDIEEWDVVNEAIHETSMIRLIDGVNTNPVEAPILAEWYHQAAEAAPDDVSLAVNDYNTLTGPNHSTRNSYHSQIEFLLEEDVDLGGIGLQSHFGASSRLDPGQIIEGLNGYAEHGVPIRITEFDTYQGSWDSDEEKAEFLHTFLKSVFSHPATGDFLMWGFWDGRHWEGDAPLFYEDWSEKPGYEAYTDLVFDEWWTEATETTDSDGVATLDGFKGDYEITASYGDESETVTTALTDEETVELTLDVDVDSDGVPGFGVLPGLAGLAGVSVYLLSQREGHGHDE